MAKQMPKRNLEKVGLSVTGACVALVTLVVVALIFMVAQRGLSTFFKDGVSIAEFFTSTRWNLAMTNEETGLPFPGALPLIVTSFAVTIFSTVIAVPIAIAVGTTFATEGARPLEGLQFYHYLMFIAIGYVVAITQVVPGLSATAVLMIEGYFQPIMDSVSLTYWQADPTVFAVYACLGIGFLAGLISFSKGLTKIFERHKKTAFFCICGLSLASILTMFFNPEVYAVYQNWAGGAPFALDLGLGIVLFLAGAVVSYLFVRYERKKKI